MDICSVFICSYAKNVKIVEISLLFRRICLKFYVESLCWLPSKFFLSDIFAIYLQSCKAGSHILPGVWLFGHKILWTLYRQANFLFRHINIVCLSYHKPICKYGQLYNYKIHSFTFYAFHINSYSCSLRISQKHKWRDERTDRRTDTHKYT